MSPADAAGAGPRCAAFVSPHGFGHAARASAVLAALHERTGAGFELFTTAPRWFFDESIEGTFRYHEVECDVGFRQRSALVYDLPATVEALNRLVPFDEDVLDACADAVVSSRCGAVLCDIAPMGIAVAERAGVPSVLVESFTWSWLYEPLFDEEPALRRFARELDEWVERATVRVQTQPLCRRDPRLELVPPIGRRPRRDRAAVRSALGIDQERPLVVVTMGGYGEDLPFLDRLCALDPVTFLVTGAARSERSGNLLLFDNRTPLFMPDLLAAADALVAKLGYGTVAEAWAAGLPFARVTRSAFAEMPPLEAFAERRLEGFLVTPDEYRAGAWIGRIAELLALPRRPRPPEEGGADRVAELLARYVPPAARSGSLTART